MLLYYSDIIISTQLTYVLPVPMMMLLVSNHLYSDNSGCGLSLNKPHNDADKPVMHYLTCRTWRPLVSNVIIRKTLVHLMLGGELPYYKEVIVQTFATW